MSETTKTAPCPTCQTESEKSIQMPTFIRKGGGWYRPDPVIPEKIRKMSNEELNADLGLPLDHA